MDDTQYPDDDLATFFGSPDARHAALDAQRAADTASGSIDHAVDHVHEGEQFWEKCIPRLCAPERESSSYLRELNPTGRS